MATELERLNLIGGPIHQVLDVFVGEALVGCIGGTLQRSTEVFLLRLLMSFFCFLCCLRAIISILLYNTMLLYSSPLVILPNTT